MRKGRHFLITNANSFHRLQAPQKMSQIWMNTPLSWIHAVQPPPKPYEGFKMYIAGEMWQNLKRFLLLLLLLLLKRMHDNKTMKESYATYHIKHIKPTKLYTPLLCTTKIWLSLMNVVKSY